MKINQLTRIYITSNEYRQASTCATLKDRSPSTEGKIKAHLGVSTTFNLIAGQAGGAEEIFLIDASPVTVEVNRKMIDLLKHCRDQSDFLNQLADFCLHVVKSRGLDYADCSVQTPPDTAARRYNTSHIPFERLINAQGEIEKQYTSDEKFKEIFKKILTQTGGLCAQNQNFNAWVQMAQTGRIQAMQLDLTDSRQIAQLKAELDQRAIEVHTLYVANVIEWVERDSPEKVVDFYQNIALLEPNSVIDSYSPEPTPTRWGINLQQRVSSLEDFLKRGRPVADHNQPDLTTG